MSLSETLRAASWLPGSVDRARSRPGPELSEPVPDRPLPFLWGYVRRRQGMFAGLLVLIVGAASCAVAVQWGMKVLVDAMALETRSLSAAWYAFALFISLIAVENALWRCSGWLGCRTIVATGVDMRLDLFEHLSGHSAGYFANQMTGALGSRVNNLGQAFRAIAISMTWNVTPPIVDFLGALVVMTLVDWRLAAALAVFALVVGIGLSIVGARGRPLHHRFAEEAASTGGELMDTVANVTLVKAFAARSREQKRLMRKLDMEGDAERRSWMFVERMRVLHDICLWVMAGSMLAAVIYLWSVGEVTPGDVVLISALTFRILHSSRDLALNFVELSQHLAAVGETLQMIVRPHAVADKPDAPALDAPHGAVSFQGVRFGYGAGGGAGVLRGLDLEIPAGQSVGIVGPSGAGKSTLLSLLQRFYDLDEGRILIDGQDITDVGQESLRGAISMVPQETMMFHRSVRENVRYGRPAASDDEVVAAAQAAHCHDFIMALPEGYDTMVGERGVKLSGGQRQRIAIARALLKDAPVVLLDEATSALDSEVEKRLQEGLDALSQGRTVLAVAHRLSTVAKFDRIVVLIDGVVVEDGPPTELRRSGGVFDRMWRLQAEGFDIDDFSYAGAAAR